MPLDAEEGAQSVSRYRLELVCEGEIPYGDRVASQPALAIPLVREIVGGRDREVLGALFLDVNGRIIGYTIAHVGTISRAIFEPRGILVPALLMNAVGIILFHNRPSGDPTPIPEDLLMTRRARDAGEIVGIRVVDHLILGSKSTYGSLQERGELG